MSEPPQAYSPPYPVAPRRRLRHPAAVATGVLAGVILLCGGVAGTGWLVTSRPQGTGSSDPQRVATAFLTGVYLHEDVDEAMEYVCPQADPSDIQHRVDDAAKITAKYNNAMYSWGAYSVTDRTSNKATITTTLTLTTRDNGSTTQTVTLDTVENHGWWVCGVHTAGQ